MHVTEEWLRQRLQGGSATSGEKVPGKNKYGAEKTGGHASKKENRRANDLRLMEKAGAITDLAEQVEYVLVPAQFDTDGKSLERAVKYIADFVYIENGSVVVEDTKGYRTPEYKIKRKLMLWVHGIRITET